MLILNKEMNSNTLLAISPEAQKDIFIIFTTNKCYIYLIVLIFLNSSSNSICSNFLLYITNSMSKILYQTID